MCVVFFGFFFAYVELIGDFWISTGEKLQCSPYYIQSKVPRQTLASRGLEELFFQLCCCVSFWFWRDIGFGFTYLHTLLNNFLELIFS